MKKKEKKRNEEEEEEKKVGLLLYVNEYPTLYIILYLCSTYYVLHKEYLINNRSIVNSLARNSCLFFVCVLHRSTTNST
jgi:hypothetical protein